MRAEALGVQRALLARLVLALVVLVPAGGYAASPPRDGIDDAAASERTMRQMRRVGMAMWSWIVDQGGLYQRPPAVPGSGAWYLSAEEVAAVLVPDYLNEVPRVDGWGHAYEYRLLAEAPPASGSTTGHAVIRSPGRDGLLAREHYYEYRRGTFDPHDFDQDIVWVDWRFTRLPGRNELP